MDYNALMHAHKGILYLFLAQLTFKIVLMALNRPSFDKLQPKLKILDMVLGPLILISGFAIVHALDWNFQSWLVVKIIVVLAAIPLAIIGLKKGSLPLAGISLLIFIAIFVMMTNGSMKKLLSEEPTQSLLPHAAMYDQIDCASIHGSFAQAPNSSPKVAEPKTDNLCVVNL